MKKTSISFLFTFSLSVNLLLLKSRYLMNYLFLNHVVSSLFPTMFVVDYSLIMNNQVKRIVLNVDNNFSSHSYFVFQHIDKMKNVHHSYHRMLVRCLDVNDEYDMYLTVIELEDLWIMSLIDQYHKHHLKQKEIHVNEIDLLECY